MRPATQLPWLSAPWEQAVTALGTERLPAGVLILGRPGLGRSRLAEAIARARLCLDPREDCAACGHCAACRRMDAGAHPDFLCVEPEEGKSAILVDQIRELSRRLSLTAGGKGARCAVINPADKLGDSASNALLKTLEEPPEGVSLILIADNTAHLLPTVISRCLRLPVPAPQPQPALDWLNRERGARSDWPLLLALAGGAPLAAGKLAQDSAGSLLPALDALSAAVSGRDDPIVVANEFSKWPLARFAVLIGWLAWVALRTRLVERPRAGGFPGLERFASLAARADARRLLETWKEAGEVADDAVIRNDALARERLLLLFVNAFDLEQSQGVQP
ncbi:MAG: DNA polymerase III subunit delta' [Gammaproteobacteria bacterium]|nr:DNA polymerase III subunit delta' [Gammaproteobacteria bacterium]